MMVNEIVKDKIKFVSILKWLLVIFSMGFIFHFPDVIGHGILWVVHTFYEATSFVLEHFLMHTYHIEKELAQLIVFYFSVVVGVSTTILLWRFWLRDYLLFKLYAYQHQLIFYWHSKPKFQKAKLILINSTIMIAAVLYLTM